MLQRYGRLKLTSCLSINLQVQVQVSKQIIYAAASVVDREKLFLT